METTRNIRNEASSIAESAAEKARNLAHGAPQQLQERAQDLYQDLQKRAKDYTEASEDMIKSHPFYSVLGAVAVGFVCGALLGRRR
jgi:ElaB/YqjD/DUF883 family membrane-anchored ribosome-binding protein